MSVDSLINAVSNQIHHVRDHIKRYFCITNGEAQILISKNTRVKNKIRDLFFVKLLL